MHTRVGETELKQSSAGVMAQRLKALAVLPETQELNAWHPMALMAICNSMQVLGMDVVHIHAGQTPIHNSKPYSLISFNLLNAECYFKIP